MRKKKSVSYSTIEELLKIRAKYPVLTKEEEVKLVKLKERGNKKAFDKLVCSNVGLVLATLPVFGRLASQRFTLDDIVQEGMYALYKAVKGFRSKEKTRVSTYAVVSIKRTISRAILVHGRPIRFSRKVVIELSQFRAMKDAFTQEFGRPPTSEEIASKTGHTLKRVCLYECLDNANIISTSTLVCGEEMESIFPVIGHRSINGTTLDCKEWSDRVMEVLERDFDRIFGRWRMSNQFVLRDFFGLGYTRSPTPEESIEIENLNRSQRNNIKLNGKKRLEKESPDLFALFLQLQEKS